MQEHLDQFLDYSVVNAHLQLPLSPSSHIGEHPASLLPHRFLLVGQDVAQSWDQVSLDGQLSFIVVTSHNVSDGSEAWNGNCHVLVVHEVDKFDKQTLIEHVWDAIPVAVGQVGKSPADVSDDVFFIIFNQNLYQRWNSSFYLLVIWLGSSSAKIGKCPRSISHERSTWHGLVQH